MAADKLFDMDNPKGVCTAASMLWVNMMLTHQTPQQHHFNKAAILELMHNNVSDLDHDPVNQVHTSSLPLESVATQSGGWYSSKQIAELFCTTAPHIGIFWNSFHTMGYSYGHLNKYYFDNNYALWRADKTKDIVAKMEEIRTGKYGEAWSGYTVLKPKKGGLRLVL